MPLNSNVLGTAIYNVRLTFNNRTMDDLLNEYGSLEGVRLAEAKDEAAAIIDHFKNNAEILVPGQPPGIIN